MPTGVLNDNEYHNTVKYHKRTACGRWNTSPNKKTSNTLVTNESFHFGSLFRVCASDFSQLCFELRRFPWRCACWAVEAVLLPSLPATMWCFCCRDPGRSWTSTLAPWYLEIWVMKPQPLFLQENLGGKWKVFDLYAMKNGSEGELMKKS